MPVTTVETVELALDQIFNSRRMDPELLTADVLWVNPHNAVEPGTREGADEFNRAIESVFAAWDDLHFDIERIVENGDEAVSLGRIHGRLHNSGMGVSAAHAQVWTVRDGRIARMCWFNTHREALEAAGLQPDA